MWKNDHPRLRLGWYFSSCVNLPIHLHPRAVWLYYSLKILFCSHMKDTLFPQERYFVHSIYYFVPTTYHLGTGIQKCGWVKQVFLDTILKGDHPRTIVTNFDSSWLGGFRKEDLWMCFPRVFYVKLSSPLAVILDRTRTCQTQFWKGTI